MPSETPELALSDVTGKAPALPAKNYGDIALRFLAKGSGILILMMLLTLLAVLSTKAIPSVREFGSHFLVTSGWRPNALERPKRGPDGKVLIDDGQVVMETIPPAFGALPVIYGTTVSSALAILFSVPVSFGAALFLVRAAPKFLVGPVSFLIEFLAAIPSLAYGIWGLFVLGPFLQHTVEPFLQRMLGALPGFAWLFTQRLENGAVVPVSLTGRDMFAGGLVLAIMILPIITAIGRDVLRAVPRAQIEGSVALGATWWQSCVEMLKYSRSGLFGAVMLGLARAAGETMAIAMVIGNNNQIQWSPFAPAQTMSSLLANEFAEASSDTHRSALVEVALILLVMSLIFNVVARALVVGRGSRTAAAQ